METSVVSTQLQGRRYNTGVRVGNWLEDLYLEELTLHDFLEQESNGELRVQKHQAFIKKIMQPRELSITHTGAINFGDVIMLLNVGSKVMDEERPPTALSLDFDQDVKIKEGCGVVSSAITKPTYRTAFTVTSFDGTGKGEPLRYGEHFYLKATDDCELWLTSKMACLTLTAKPSGRNPVFLAPQPSHLSEWKVLPFKPKDRMELEYTPVPANEKVCIANVKTGHCLCLEQKHTKSTWLGRDHQVTATTKLDSHRAEKEVNHWVMVVREPEDPHFPVNDDMIMHYTVR